MLSLRYPMEVNLVGDAADTLRALLPLLKQRKTRVAGAKRLPIMSKPGGKRLKSEPWRRPIPLTRNASLGNCRRDCPIGSFLPAIQARAPIGMRAT